MQRNDPRKDKESGFGEYQEARGGGTPVGPGTKYPSVSGRGAYKKAGEPGQRDDNQPRTDDGKFTYNAVNGKPLKPVSLGKDGKSRGTTIPPTMTGGENGHQYYEKDITVGKDGRKLKHPISSHKVRTEDGTEEYKIQFGDKYVLAKKNSELVGFDGKIRLAPIDFVETMQRYIEEDKEKEWKEKHSDLVDKLEQFRHGEIEKDADIEKILNHIRSDKAGHFYKDNPDEWETKKGRHSAEETQAIKKAEKRGLGKEWVEAKEGKDDEETGVKRYTKGTEPTPRDEDYDEDEDFEEEEDEVVKDFGDKDDEKIEKSEAKEIIEEAPKGKNKSSYSKSEAEDLLKFIKTEPNKTNQDSIYLSLLDEADEYFSGVSGVGDGMEKIKNYLNEVSK